MTLPVKTIVATGASSGLGFEVIKQRLDQAAQPYNFILGVRNLAKTEAAYSTLTFDHSLHKLTFVRLDLSSLATVRTFADQALAALGQTPLDHLLLNAATSNPATAPGPHGSKWSETYIVNHLSQHYLIHLLRPKLIESASRLVFVSSASFREVQDPAVFEHDLLAASGTPGRKLYAETKFVNLLGAHWWRRDLMGKCIVVAVSPGLVPGTNIGKGMGVDFTMEWPGARRVEDGAASIIEALKRNDFPDDPDLVFLTSWGEWWGRGVLEMTLDKGLQDRWCPGKEEIEREEGLDA
ncbi:hypothetical protein OQA88_13416 [Cercophora sp. LCS_1]